MGRGQKRMQIFSFVLLGGLLFCSMGLKADENSMGLIFMETPKSDQDASAFFGSLDFDKDGSVDEAEFRSRRMYNFGHRDQNKDDVITKDEVPSFSQKIFDEIDTDGDGKITAFEFHQGTPNQFKALDLNGDNKITVDELDAAFKKYAK